MASSPVKMLSFANTMSNKTSNKLFLSEHFADFHFWFNEGGIIKRIPAHKNILSAASDVFTTMLNGQWKEQSEVEIEDADYDTFVEFLQFVYPSAKVDVPMENFQKVLCLADKYDVTQCMELCEQQLIQQLTVDDVCTGLDVAIQYDLSELKDHCVKKIGERTTTEAFLGCSKRSLEVILAVDSIDCGEIKMFNASLDWAKRVCKTNKKDISVNANVREVLGDSLYAIRFGAMDQKEILDCISKNLGFFKQFELEDLWLKHDKSEVQWFKNMTARENFFNFENFLECNLQIEDPKNILVYNPFSRPSSTTFQINKTVILSKISLSTIHHHYNPYDQEANIVKANVFLFENATHQQLEVLQQAIQLHANIGEHFIKFEKTVRIQANTEYEIRIEPIKTDLSYGHHYYGTTIGSNEKRCTKDGVIIDIKTNDENLITKLEFIQCKGL